MKFLSPALFLSLLLALTTSCANVSPGGQTGSSAGYVGQMMPLGGAGGLIYSNVGAGGSLVDAGEPIVVEGLFRGESTETNILGLFSFGDSSVDAAATNGGLRDVRYVDRRVRSFLGIFATYTTVTLGMPTNARKHQVTN